MSDPLYVYVALRGEPDGAILCVAFDHGTAQAAADLDAATTMECGGHFVEQHPITGTLSSGSLVRVVAKPNVKVLHR